MSKVDVNRKNARPHLGVGWSFPVKPVNGRLCYAEYEQDVEQAIGIILETSQHERVMRPRFGGSLHDFLFEGNSSTTHNRIEESVKRALLTWEPRIKVENVTATAPDNEPNLVLIAIDYVVRRSNAFYNRVYPYYLNEAG